MKTITKANECYYCQHCEALKFNAHKKCTRPDPAMTGDKNGVENGWFDYPENFDPVWKEKDCKNFEVRGPESIRNNFKNTARFPWRFEE